MEFYICSDPAGEERLLQAEGRRRPDRYQERHRGEPPECHRR